MSHIIYRHFKGGLYRILYEATFQTTGKAKYLLDGVKVAVYISLKDGTIHVRPKEEFNEWVHFPPEAIMPSMPRFQGETVVDD